MEKLVIDRAKWLRGQGGGSLLEPQSGKMCCLGFECLRLGFTENDISNKGYPSNILKVMDETIRLPEYLRGYLIEENCFCTQAAKVNDTKGLNEFEREVKIKELFAGVGIEVEFIN